MIRRLKRWWYRKLGLDEEAPRMADSDDWRSETARGFKEGWRDAMEGRTYPIETLWDDWDDDSDRSAD